MGACSTIATKEGRAHTTRLVGVALILPIKTGAGQLWQSVLKSNDVNALLATWEGVLCNIQCSIISGLKVH